MRTLLSWSSGKDSAWALHCLQATGAAEVVALVTSISEDVGRVAMHATRRKLLQQQAQAIGLPLLEVLLPRPCSNAEYELRFSAALSTLRRKFNVDQIAFGDLFLRDIRAYRERQMAGLNFTPLFPLWGKDTANLARTMLAGGLQARLSCIDPRVMPVELAGRAFDQQLLDDLPEQVDPCGENGEFHSFCWSSPSFSNDINITIGETIERDGFVFTDLLEGPE